MIRVRFAPSHTGLLHIGNARTAIVNWLFAKKHSGHFLLRLDDTDKERSTSAFAEQILHDLAWLEMTADEMIKQSDRLDRYALAVAHLKQSGRLYPCYESPEELDFKRKRQLSRGEPPIYDRAALNLTAEQKACLEAEGHRPHWRFLLEDKKITWEDAVRGLVEFHASNLSDPILIKADGNPIYTLASVVDDIELGITHIIRGEDHLTNSAVQLQLFEALGADTSKIHLAHLSLLIDARGQGFSKREGSLSLKKLREDGIEAMAIMSLLGTIGTSENIQPSWDKGTLIRLFDLKKFARSTPKFDVAELQKINLSLLHTMPYEIACTRWREKHIPPLDANAWEVLKGNITSLEDARLWSHILSEDFAPPSPSSPDVISAARETLPPAPWDEHTWVTWTKAVQEMTHKKGKELFMPLRLVLTGMEHGPEMRSLLLLIGYEKVQQRLQKLG